MKKENDYISFKKLYNSIKPIANLYKLHNEYCSSQVHVLTAYALDQYYLDYYDYDRDRLVIGERSPYSIYDDNHLYVKLVNGKLDINCEKIDDYFFDLVFKNEDFFKKSISTYQKFREFKTIKLEDAHIIDDDKKENYFLDVSCHCLAFGKSSKDRELLRYTRYFYNNSKSIEGSRSRIDFIRDNEKALISYKLKIDKSKLPDWCKRAINAYDRKPKNRISNLIERFQMNRDRLVKIDSNISESFDIKVNSDGDYDRVCVPNDLLFKRVDDHFEINDTYKDNLKYIDLSNIDFTNVLVSGIDFTDTNITYFDPQTVFKKDLSYSSFGDIDNKDNNIPFSIYTDFNGVNLCGTVILGDSDFRFNLDGALTDENTKVIYNHSANKIKKKK